MKTVQDHLRELMTPVQPLGVEYRPCEAHGHLPCKVVNRSWIETGTDLVEGAGQLEKLVGDLTAQKLKPKKDRVTEKTLAVHIDRQREIKADYREKLAFLLSKAENEGPKSRAQIVGNFRGLIRDAYRESYMAGMLATSSGVKSPDRLMLATLQREADDEVNYFSKFLRAIWNDEEIMPRDRRAGMYVDALDSLFSLGALTGTPYRILVYWKMCITTGTSRVLTYRGMVPIADVIPGDMVLTHKLQWREVKAVHHRLSQPWHESMIVNGVGCTTDHEFYTSNGWKCIKRIALSSVPILTLQGEAGSYALREVSYDVKSQGLVPSGVTLYDLTVDEDSSFIVEGIVSHNSPAEHCIDCYTLAANSPYAKPGDIVVDRDTLPTVPRRGDTQCLSNCKCYLEYVKEDDPDYHYEPRARPGVTVEPKPESERSADDPDTIDENDPEIIAAQKEGDQIETDLAYYKAMAELTGDPEYRKKRQELLARQVELQDSLGIRLVPRTEADVMVNLARQAQAEGFDPVFKLDSYKPTAGIQAGLLRGATFERGVIENYSDGRGIFESVDGVKSPIALDDSQSSILFVDNAKEFINRPWSVFRPEDPTAFHTQMNGYQASYAENFGADECMREEYLRESRNLCDVRGAIEAFRSILRSRPRVETFGMQLSIEAPSSKVRGFVIDGEAVRFSHYYTHQPLDYQESRRALREATGAYIYSIRLAQADRDAFESLVSKISDSGNLFDSVYAVDDSLPESKFGAVYALFLEQPRGFRVSYPDVYAFVERVLGGLT